ncbi:hypothetical protein [Arthrobacter sp. SLBN-53]|uniref:hypothetical protein n=1 Tax=Arthrobacter sp. SLBN-53 TaxID=2768412 RepID=UPI0011665B09|nr:hypothetical protein [Arthrobacter sp. SLBN-53]TQK27889.1 hypothetical protein FBY28_0851 [Arthrobacter sp. SLBN-53]
MNPRSVSLRLAIKAVDPDILDDYAWDSWDDDELMGLLSAQQLHQVNSFLTAWQEVQ